jgi:hypothetical protein
MVCDKLSYKAGKNIYNRFFLFKSIFNSITTNTKEIQGIIRDDFENLCSNKFENLEEMDKFLDTYDHPKLNQEDINHLNR